MKKLLSIIFAISILLTFAGCKDVKEDENLSDTNQIISIETQRLDAEKDAEIVEKAPVIENLSEEDKAIKAEIEKYVSTEAVFKQNRQEKIGDKTYDLSFDRVGFAGGNDDKSKRVTYKNSDEDEFVYDTKSGKLKYVTFYSNTVEKDETSIDIEQAQKIAYKLASENSNIGQYTLNEAQEIFDGYSFQWSRFVKGYRTSENIRVRIGFDGSLVYLGIFTDACDGVDLEAKINEDLINKKIEEFLDGESVEEISDKLIFVEDGKLCLMVIRGPYAHTIPLEENNTEDGSVS